MSFPTATGAAEIYFYGVGDLRYGYFWPFPSAHAPLSSLSPNGQGYSSSSNDNYEEPTLLDVQREMADEHDTMPDMPVYAITSSNYGANVIILAPTPIREQSIIMKEVSDQDIIVRQIDEAWE